MLQDGRHLLKTLDGFVTALRLCIAQATNAGMVTENCVSLIDMYKNFQFFFPSSLECVPYRFLNVTGQMSALHYF